MKIDIGLHERLPNLFSMENCFAGLAKNIP